MTSHAKYDITQVTRGVVTALLLNPVQSNGVRCRCALVASLTPTLSIEAYPIFCFFFYDHTQWNIGPASFTFPLGRGRTPYHLF